MNTVARGNKFEDRVFDALRTEVNAERLGLLPKQCHLFQKKPYYSRDRDSNIIVDISIEVTLDGASTWSLLWICECKDYNGSLPINDVEEFKAKLDQIAGKNVKGLLAVTGALQSGALQYAKSNGIGLVRMLPSDQIQWVIYFETGERMNAKLDPAEFNRAFISPEYRARNQEFFGRADGYIFQSWHGLLQKTLATPPET